MAYATLDDVRAAYEGDTLPASDDRVNYLLRVVSARLTALRPGLPMWLDAHLVDADLVTDIVVRAVLRDVRHPDSSVANLSQTAGPFSTTTTYRQDTGGDALFDEADLAALVLPGATSFGVGTIKLNAPDYTPRLPPRTWRNRGAD